MIDRLPRLVAIAIDFSALPFIAIGLALVVLGGALIRRPGQTRGRQDLGWILFFAGVLITGLRIR